MRSARNKQASYKHQRQQFDRVVGDFLTNVVALVAKLPLKGLVLFAREGSPPDAMNSSCGAWHKDNRLRKDLQSTRSSLEKHYVMCIHKQETSEKCKQNVVLQLQPSNAILPGVAVRQQSAWFFLQKLGKPEIHVACSSRVLSARLSYSSLTGARSGEFYPHSHAYITLMYVQHIYPFLNTYSHSTTTPSPA